MAVHIRDFIKETYVVFGLNEYLLPALIDTGSAFNIVDEDIYQKDGEGADASIIRAIAAEGLKLRGILGKQAVKVKINAHSTVAVSYTHLTLPTIYSV